MGDSAQHSSIAPPLTHAYIKPHAGIALVQAKE